MALARTVRFCSYCGALAEDRDARVCSRCGLGVVLSAPHGVLLEPGAAFLLIGGDLRISAASTAVESILARPAQLIGEPLLALVGATRDDEELIRRVVEATTGRPSDVVRMELRSRTGERRLSACIAPCGDPPAALIVLA